MPLPLALTGNFLIMKEVEGGTIEFVLTRQSMEQIWLYRILGFLLLSILTNKLLISITNLIYGPILPPVMMFTLFVPTLLFSGLMGITTGVTKNPYIGAGTGIAIWLYFYLYSESLSSRMSFNDIVYYPFIEWLIFFKDRSYLMTSLIPNRLVISTVSIVLLLLSFFLYKYNLRFRYKF